jgi:carbamate kinase
MPAKSPEEPQAPEQTSLVRPLAVVAFGGNALIQARDLGTVGEQIRRANEAAVWLTDVCRDGYDLLIVHGNGPQVGRILIQMREGAAMVPPATMDFAVAETQGSVGYLLSLALLNRLRTERVPREVATVVSLVAVERGDPGFENPTKPVGPFFSEYQAQQMAADGDWKMMEDAGRGWRKVVASPHPVEVLGVDTVRDLLARNHVVIAGGGGGIPVVLDPDGDYRGVEAVIDKDRTAALLALQLSAELLVIVTEVPEVYRNFGQKNQKVLRKMTVREARRLLAAGQFPAGSMGPKVESAADFVEASGGRAVITDSEHLPASLAGRAGTTVVAI